MNNQTNNRITLRAKSHRTITITGELMYEHLTWFEVCLAPGVSAHSFIKDEWERVYSQPPTEPGTVIRATIRGVPNVRAFRFEAEFAVWWRSVEAIEGRYWHRDEDIDASTVVVELEGDKEGDA